MAVIWNCLIRRGFIPPAGSDDRLVLYWGVAKRLINRIQSLQPTDCRDRLEATYAALQAQGHWKPVNQEFMNWMLHIRTDIMEGSERSDILLKKSPIHQLGNLIRKVILSAGFYATGHVSLYATLTHLSKVAKVIQPILDRVASIPLPRPLQSAHVIVFAPVIVQLLHMALLAADSQEHSIVLHWLKKSAEKVGETLEFVGCLRLILISLSISKNIYLLVAWDLIEQAFRKFVPPITLHDMEIPTRLPVQVATLLVEIILTRLAWLFKRAKGEAPTGLRYLVNLLAERETGWCASGREAGFHGMWHTGFFSAPPYDVKCLEKMYTTIQGWHREQKEPEEIPQAFKDYITAQPLVQQFEGLARNKSVFCKP